jgi:hypothetical protein
VLFGDPLLPCEPLRRGALLRTTKRGFGVRESLFELITSSSSVVNFRRQLCFAFGQVPGGGLRISLSIRARLLERCDRGAQPLVHGAAIARHSVGRGGCIRLVSSEGVRKRSRFVDSPLFGRTERSMRFIQPSFERPANLGFAGELPLEFLLTRVQRLGRRLLRGSSRLNFPQRGIAISERLFETPDRRFGELQLCPKHGFSMGKLLSGGNRVGDSSFASLFDCRDCLAQSPFGVLACDPVRFQLAGEFADCRTASFPRLISKQRGMSAKTV